MQIYTGKESGKHKENTGDDMMRIKVMGASLWLLACLSVMLPASAGSRSQEEFFLPQKTVTVNGTDVAYYEQGSGRPILFIHGIPTWSYLWRNIMPEVATTGRAIALDLPGFGATDPVTSATPQAHAKFLEDFVEALDLKDIVLVLHDFGAIGLNYAARHPENVAGVAFMELPLQAWYTSTPDADALFPARASDAQKRFIAMVRDQAFSHDLIVEKNIFFADPLFASAHRDWSEKETRAYQAPFADRARRKALRDLVSNLLLDGQPEASAKLVREQSEWLLADNVPKLAIIGDPGRYISPDFLNRYLTEIEQLSIVEIEDSVHFLMEDHPEEVAQSLAVWLTIHFNNSEGTPK